MTYSIKCAGLCFVWFMFLGCSSTDSSDSSSDTDSDADSDTDTDADTDAETDSKTDSKTDSDTTATSGCNAASWPESGPVTLDVDGTEREFIITLPENYDSAQPYRVVFAWHGLGGTMESIAGNEWWGYYGLTAYSEDTTIYISGQGLPSTPDDTDYRWDNTDGDDVAYTQAIVDWLRQNYCIDNGRIFGVGMSYGGVMSNTIGCYMGDVFRAIAPIAGAGPGSWFNGTPPTDCVGRVAAWIAHGTADETVPFEQGEYSRDYWLSVADCGDTTQPVSPDPCVAYQGCDDGYPVHWCVHPDGHTVPDFTAEGVWNFFAQF